MDRKEFLKVCGGSCLGLMGISLLNQSCTGTHYVQSVADKNQLPVPKTEFTEIKKNKTEFRKYIVVKSDKIEQPIIVYRKADNSYEALLLRCTHQGIELNVNGDILTCSAHGSEFSNKGEVIQGPADQKLKSFVVTNDEKNIYIQLV
ncbi:MAG: Rieske (2Fe-2S) protein [Bacteroidetes bacterium]|nr:Rieske (2Fe-2S) protein [Bacteroidota bacterium]